MGLAERQAAIAKLATNSKLRSSFATHPEKTLEQFGLNEQDIARLSKLSPSDLDRFAVGLLWKREGVVRTLLPLTYAKMGKSFSERFMEYSSIGAPVGVRKHLEDALAFAEYLIKLNIKSSLSQETLHLLTYEAYGLKASLPKPFFRISIMRLRLSHSASVTNPASLPAQFLCIWLRPHQNLRLRHYRIPIGK